MIKNMYVAIWRSLTSKPKRAMKSCQDKVQDNGPTFLFYLLPHYDGTASQIVLSTQAKINMLKTKMIHAFCWNVDKFTTYASNLLIQLNENGGTDNHVFGKIYDLLTTSPCSMFNSEIVVYR